MAGPDDPFGPIYYCECESGWRGRGCDICTSMESCRPFYNESVTPVCDQTIIPIRRKAVWCNATDPQLEQLGLFNLSIAFQLNGAGLGDGTGEGDLQVWP